MIKENDLQRTRATATRRRAPRHAPQCGRFKGIASLLISVLLLCYAVPCFAASIWDEGLQPQHSGTYFASPINDAALSDEQAELAAETASEGGAVRAASKMDASVSETTGPGIASDEDAVLAAKKRVQAVSAAQVERASVIDSMTAAPVKAPDRTLELMTASLALLIAFLFGMLGVRSIVFARRTRAVVAQNSYGQILKA